MNIPIYIRNIKNIFVMVPVFFFIVIYLTFNDCSAGNYPEAVRIQQSFNKGDVFYYQLTKTRPEISKEGEQKGGTETFLYCMEVASVSNGGIMNIIITQKDGSIIGELWGENRVLPSRTIGKQVKIELMPDGKIGNIEGDIQYINWRELILQNLPQEEVQVGSFWESVHPLPKRLAEKGTTKRKTIILGFEEVNGYDCVKVKIVTATEGKQKEVSLDIRCKKVVFLAFRKGFLVVKSHSIYKSLLTSGCNSSKTPSIREISAELLDADVKRLWQKAFRFIQRGKKYQHEKDSIKALLAYQKAMEILKLISSQQPDWSPKAVKAKIEECKQAFGQLKKEPEPTPPQAKSDDKLRGVKV